MKKIGLIAGNRRFPIIFSEAAKRQGYFIVAAAVKGDTSRALSRHVDKIYWFGLDEFLKLPEIFKKEGVTDVVMAGQVSPHRLFSREVRNSRQLKNLLEGIENQKADTIFGAIVKQLQDRGLTFLDSTSFLKERMPQKGTLTLKEPNFREWEDIYFGFDLAKAVASLDIGQTIAVKNKAIVAVEALEGTDNLIKRAGRISRGGFILVKVSKPKQDMRFDIPVVGPTTVKNLLKAKANCLAIEAGKTLFIDKDKAVALANQSGLVLVVI